MFMLGKLRLNVWIGPTCPSDVPKQTATPTWKLAPVACLAFTDGKCGARKKETLYRVHLGARRIGHLRAGSEIN